MCCRKLSLLPTSALALFGVLVTLPVSPALARRLPPRPAIPASNVFQVHARSSSRTRPAGLHPVVRPPVRVGSRPRIIGGYGAVQSDWPFMAFVAYFDASGNPEFNCTGTVVAPNVVLTAAHCAVDETTGAPLDPAGFAVVTGSVDWTNQSQRQVSQSRGSSSIRATSRYRRTRSTRRCWFCRIRPARRRSRWPRVRTSTSMSAVQGRSSPAGARPTTATL